MIHGIFKLRSQGLHFIKIINRESHSLENLQRILYDDPISINTFV